MGFVRFESKISRKRSVCPLFVQDIGLGPTDDPSSIAVRACRPLGFSEAEPGVSCLGVRFSCSGMDPGPGWIW
jgi:hypothetical protein